MSEETVDTVAEEAKSATNNTEEHDSSTPYQMEPSSGTQYSSDASSPNDEIIEKEENFASVYI